MKYLAKKIANRWRLPDFSAGSSWSSWQWWTRRTAWPPWPTRPPWPPWPWRSKYIQVSQHPGSLGLRVPLKRAFIPASVLPVMLHFANIWQERSAGEALWWREATRNLLRIHFSTGGADSSLVLRFSSGKNAECLMLIWPVYPVSDLSWHVTAFQHVNV